MRPPTRSTRSVRLPPSKAITNARRNRGSSRPLRPPASSSSEVRGGDNVTPPKHKHQSIITAAAAVADADDDDAKVDPGTLPGSVPASAPVVGCFPVLPPATLVFENQSRYPPPDSPFVSPNPDAGVTVLGKPTRSRYRMSKEKVEQLDAFFRHNTHPSRKEKEAICKDLDMDLKTVTIWFQNKRQTVARSRKHLESEDATSSAAAMDMLASASATMSPLAATEKSPASSASAATVQLGSGTGTPRLQRASSRHSFLKPKSHPLVPPRVLLSTVAHDPKVSFTPVRAEMLSSSSISISSPSPGLRKSRLGHNWPIHPEDLWKHIPSSPAQPASSSPDVSPDISASSSRSSRLSVQQPRTLEWACARSAKRRRANPDTDHHVDDEIDNECNSVDRSHPRRSSFLGSEAQVPLECYDKYPLDVVRGAVLLLGLRDAARGLGI